MQKTQHSENAEKTCISCRYGDNLVNAQAATVTLICRRNCPGAQGQVLGVDQATHAPIWTYTALWPGVNPSDWCGEWTRKLNA